MPKTQSANVTILNFPDGRSLCLSYGVPVAGFVPGVGAVKTREKYSVTTSKHAGQYTRETGATITELDDQAFRAHFPEFGTLPTIAPRAGVRGRGRGRV